MNINFNSIVSAGKAAVASEGGKAVVKVIKTVGNKALVGFGYGASAGALVLGTKVGYKAATKGVPAVCRPFVDILDKMVAGEDDFTVTFKKCEAPKKGDETKEENDSEKSEE